MYDTQQVQQGIVALQWLVISLALVPAVLVVWRSW